MDSLVGAAKGQHAPQERTTYRNGYRERPLHTRLGTLELRIPKLRQGSDFPSCLEPRRLSERALTAVIQEASFGTVGCLRAAGCHLTQESHTGVHEITPLDGHYLGLL